MKPTSYEMLLWKSYSELTDKYLNEIAGDDVLPLAQKKAIAETARIADMSEEDVKQAIDNVCRWLMGGFVKKG